MPSLPAGMLGAGIPSDTGMGLSSSTAPAPSKGGTAQQSQDGAGALPRLSSKEQVSTHCQCLAQSGKTHQPVLPLSNMVSSAKSWWLLLQGMSKGCCRDLRSERQELAVLQEASVLPGQGMSGKHKGEWL